MPHKYKASLFLLFLFSTPIFSIEYKETIFDKLESDADSLKKVSNSCFSAYNSYPNRHLTTKICSSAAISATSFLTYMDALAIISKEESRSMLNLYVSKHGEARLKKHVQKTHEANGVAVKILNIYKIIILYGK